MLHIILLCIKIIGIILLVLIGFLLLMLFTVLLVPIRYSAQVKHGDTLYAKGKVTWLLHMIGAEFSFIQGEFHMRLRILWITLYDNLAKNKPGQKKKAKPAVKKKAQKNASNKKENKKVELKEDGDIQEINNDINEINMEINKEKIKANESDEVLQASDREDKVIDYKQEKACDDKAALITVPERSQNCDGKSDKPSALRKFIDKIRNFFKKISAFIRGVRRKVASWLNSIADIRSKIDLVIDFIRDEYNKEGFHITFQSLKRLLKHILPRKLKSRLVFGTGDPCSTGQALGAMSILYSFYGDKIVIVPDFENKRFEGEHSAVGRIRMATVLIIVVKLVLNKRFKQLKNNFQTLKEALQNG